MVRVRFVSADGEQFRDADGAAGETLLTVGQIADQPLEGTCEGQMACSTCHVHVRQGAADLAPADEAEEDQLDDAWGVDADSRLSCCVRVGNTPLVVELPRFTRNHAREA